MKTHDQSVSRYLALRLREFDIAFWKWLALGGRRDDVVTVSQLRHCAETLGEAVRVDIAMADASRENNIPRSFVNNIVVSDTMGDWSSDNEELYSNEDELFSKRKREKHKKTKSYKQYEKNRKHQKRDEKYIETYDEQRNKYDTVSDGVKTIHLNIRHQS